MEGKRFDQLARTLATGGSRRRVLGGFLLGVLGGLRLRPATADDSGTAIADASGGNHNRATVVDPAQGGNDRNGENDNDRDRQNDRDRDRDNNHDNEDPEEFCRVGVTECDCPPGGSGISCFLEAGRDVSCQCDGDVCQNNGPTSAVTTSCCSCSPDPGV